MPKFPFFPLRAALPVIALAWHLAPAAAAETSPVIVSGPAGQVTRAEVELMVDDLIAPPQRASFWSNPQAVGEFARSMYAQRALAADALKEGMDKTSRGAAYLRLVRDRTLANMLLAQRSQAKQPDDKAMESYARSEYLAKPERFAEPEQVHARHILISLPKNSDAAADEAAKTKIEALLAQLRQGADFEKLAKENSTDKANAQKGGDLGFFDRRRMVPEFTDAVFGLSKPGDLAGPVKTQFGYHIIELLERKPASRQKFEDVLPVLKEELKTKFDGEERRRVWEAAQAQAQVDEDAVKALVQPSVPQPLNAPAAAAR
ncbi:MAG: peptidylprolyl isomerase [Burkholderiaceae bacterium]|jgi:peptidyl-prolyl cis-trans isomerase C|nr:peptidylprolyl isomerase [Burkholderiaceae bacterium]